MKSLAQKTYTILSRVPEGRVTTYKALAVAAGTRGYRAIGRILRHNPYAREACPELGRRVPCHRVVKSDGTIGGFMGKTSGSAIKKKITMLRDEGVEIRHDRVVHFQSILFIF
jgi:methylated-DNA-[protein]-cysteine S-methyltransferase